MVAVGETISGWKLGRGRGPRLYSGDSRNRRAVCASTVPMVNNLYQGMALDPATGLYYERARWYSPSLGTWISQDPAGYINGANTYQFVESNPAGAVDPWGLAYPPDLPSDYPAPGVVEPPVSFPNNYEPGMGTFKVYMGPAGKGLSAMATGVDVEFMPSREARCKCKEIKLVQFVTTVNGANGRINGWHLDNGVNGGWLARLWTNIRTGPRYYNGQYPWYANQTPMRPGGLPYAHAWDQPSPSGSGVPEEAWKVYAVCIGGDGSTHSLGYVNYGIVFSGAPMYWVAGGGGSTALPGTALPPRPLTVPGLVPLPGGLAP